MLPRPGIPARMAATYGRAIQWNDGTTRYAIDFGVVEGKRRRVYSSADAWGRGETFANAAERDVELARIRAQLRSSGDLRAALAPYFDDFKVARSFGGCWTRFLEFKRWEAETGKITAEHLRTLEKHGRL